MFFFYLKHIFGVPANEAILSTALGFYSNLCFTSYLRCFFLRWQKLNRTV